MRVFILTIFFFIFSALLSPVNGQTGLYEALHNDTIYYFHLDSLKGDAKPYKIKKGVDSVQFVNLNREIVTSVLKTKFLKDTSLTETDKSEIASKLWEQIVNKKEKEESQKKLNDLEEKIKFLEDSVQIAVIKLKKEFVKFTDEKDKKDEKVFKIKGASIAFRDGVISDLQITGTMAGNYYAFTTQYIIPFKNKKQINSLNDVDDNLNVLKGVDGKYNIDMAELLEFRRKLTDVSGVYVPKDGIYAISTESPKKEIKLYKKTFSDNLDLRLYTDVTAFTPQSANGKFQTKIKYNLYTYYSIINNWAFIHHVAPYLNLKRMGDANSKLIIENAVDTTGGVVGKANQLDQFELFQNAYVESGVELNVVRWHWLHSHLSFNVIGGVYITTLDSFAVVDASNRIASVENTKDITSWFSGIELDYLIYDSEKISLAMSGEILYSDNLEKELNVDGSLILSSAVTLNIYPNPNDKKTAIFFRGKFGGWENQHNLSFEIGSHLPFSKFLSGIGF